MDEIERRLMLNMLQAKLALHRMEKTGLKRLARSSDTPEEWNATIRRLAELEIEMEETEAALAELGEENGKA